MYIKEIINGEHHGYGVIAEADVIVTEGTYDLLCYKYDIYTKK